jgi:hypothetical protein
MKSARQTLVLLAIIFASRIGRCGGLGNCPGNYVELQSKCFQYISNSDKTRVLAQSACQDLNSGWLATLDTLSLATGVVTQFTISDAYFGLYKTASCTLTTPATGCEGKLAWESSSTTGYFSNMKR